MPRAGILTYRVEIDGLRAIAVLAVISNHFSEHIFSRGYLGVDMFFVLSGFLITGALSGRTENRLLPFLADFYLRRTKRLLPALVLCLVTTAIVFSFFASNARPYLKTGLFALVGLSNLWLYTQSSDYFAESAELNPYTHTWSLGVEEQFYLVFPLLLWLGARALGARGTIGMVAGLSSLSALAWFWTSKTDELAAFYLPILRFWELGFGSTLFLCNARLPGAVLRWAGSAKLAAFCLLVLVLTGVLPLDPQVALLATVLVTGTLVLLTAPDARQLSILRARIVVHLGQISYALYLWHWPVVVLFGWTVGLSGASAVIALALSYALAHLSYRYVEEPLRRAPWSTSRWREGLAGAVLLSVSALALLLLIRAPEGSLYLGRPADLIAAGPASLQSPYASESGAFWAGSACVLSSNKEVGEDIKADQCVVGEPLESAKRRVLVIGDSFSAAFVQAFDGRHNRGISTILTSSWGAAFAPGVPNDQPWRKASDYYWSSVVPHLIATLSQDDQVVIVSDLSVFSPAEASQVRARLIDDAELGLRKLAAELALRGIGLSVLGPLPFARDAACSPERGQAQWFSPFGSTCSFLTRDETLKRMTPIADRLDALQAEGVLRVLNLFEPFCEGEVCDYVDASGTLLYRDVYSHASIEAAWSVRPLIAAHLASFWEKRPAPKPVPAAMPKGQSE